jgi:hypothetical protein
MQEVTVTRAELVRVKRDAVERARDPLARPTDCPHRATSSDANERVRAVAWLDAFRRARG